MVHIRYWRDFGYQSVRSTRDSAIAAGQDTEDPCSVACANCLEHCRDNIEPPPWPDAWELHSAPAARRQPAAVATPHEPPAAQRLQLPSASAPPLCPVRPAPRPCTPCAATAPPPPSCAPSACGLPACVAAGPTLRAAPPSPVQHCTSRPSPPPRRTVRSLCGHSGDSLSAAIAPRRPAAPAGGG